MAAKAFSRRSFPAYRAATPPRYRVARVFKLRPLAEKHAKVSGHKLRLVRFRRDQVLEDGLSP